MERDDLIFGRIAKAALLASTMAVLFPLLFGIRRLPLIALCGLEWFRAIRLRDASNVKRIFEIGVGVQLFHAGKVSFVSRSVSFRTWPGTLVLLR